MADGSQTSQPYGFWVRVRDRDSAAYAARMSGLPALLSGIFQVLVALFDETLSGGERIAFLIIAGLFVVAGIAIRRGAFFLVPIVCLVMLSGVLFSLAALAVGLFVQLRQGIPGQYLTASFTWQSIFPLLLLLMMISGLRGWWFLRRAGKTEAESKGA